MSNLNSNKLQVSLNNLDNITQNTLGFFFNRNLCQNAELESKNNKTDIFIIDLDREYDKSIIANLTNNNQYAITLHNKLKAPLLEENTYSTTKPIQADFLKQQINFIQSRLKETQAKQAVSVNDNSKLVKINRLKTNTTTNLTTDKKNEKIIEKAVSVSTQKTSNLDMALKETTDSDALSLYKSHKHVGSNKNIDPNNPEELKIVYHTQEKYLYHHLIQAVRVGQKNNSDVLIKTLFGSLLFEYDSGVFSHQFDSAKMKYLKSSPLFTEASISLTSNTKNSKTVKAITNVIKNRANTKSVKIIKSTIQNAEELIWESAILASKGKVPHGTSLTKVVEMKNWPNYSRLLVFRYMIQISSAWSTHNLSLLDTSSQLNIPQRYIFTLYNAMLAIGSAKINNTLHNVEKIDSHKRKSVFSKILSHIFNR